jgi:hypothetical protein
MAADSKKDLIDVINSWGVIFATILFFMTFLLARCSSKLHHIEKAITQTVEGVSQK